MFDELAMAKYQAVYTKALIIENSTRILFTSETQLTADVMTAMRNPLTAYIKPMFNTVPETLKTKKGQGSR
jgi:uncharacterized membrane protein